MFGPAIVYRTNVRPGYLSNKCSIMRPRAKFKQIFEKIISQNLNLYICFQPNFLPERSSLYRSRTEFFSFLKVCFPEKRCMIYELAVVGCKSRLVSGGQLAMDRVAYSPVCKCGRLWHYLARLWHGVCNPLSIVR